MRIAFAIVSLFPGGGLQRDCLEIAKLVRDHGHDVVIYTCRVHDQMLVEDIPILLLQNDVVTNHQRQYRFATDFLREASHQYDLTVGFDKLLGLDVLYCADASIAFRTSTRPLLKMLPRYRTFRNIEKDTFSSNKKTRIIILSHNQYSEYRSAWGTEPSRMMLVPPTMATSRRKPHYRTDGTRQKFRSQLNIKESDWVWISVGVQPWTKGIDRTIEALVKFPDATLLIAGLDQTNKNSIKMLNLARTFGVTSRIKWLGHREDIPRLMAAADLLVHPARYDTTGTVILEAIVNGLPVITTMACGYAHHVNSADAGIVVRNPFDVRMFVGAFEEAQDPVRRDAWSAAGMAYGKNPLLYEGRNCAAKIIANLAHDKTLAVSGSALALTEHHEEWHRLNGHIPPIVTNNPVDHANLNERPIRYPARDEAHSRVAGKDR
jgi:UDP-glucose:(heptosyl)LPS alpha-1,3-glucosyltransferase